MFDRRRASIKIISRGKMKLIINIIMCFALVLLIGCEKENDVQNNPRGHNIQGDYFPDKTFSKEESRNSFINEWYGENLTALKEPSIYAQKDDGSKQIYRFTWLRTFHHPISIRLEIQKDGTGLLFVKMTSGAGGYDPGEIKKSFKKNIEKEGVNKFLDLLNKEGFWELQVTSNVIGLDGAQWIIEALSEGRYHLVDRWTPEEGSVREIGLYFLKLGELRVREIY